MKETTETRPTTGHPIRCFLLAVLCLGSAPFSPPAATAETALTNTNQSVPARTVTAPRAEKPPVLDGKLDDACWQVGSWYSDFTDLNAPEKRIAVQTHFQFAFDNHNLYLAARLDEPQMDKLKAEATEHDGKLWLDDCLELCIDPYGQGAEYRHFIVNARGAWYDASRDQGGHVADQSWDANLTVATQRASDHWTIELAIPLVELGLNQSSQGRWGVQVGRERHAGGTTELSSFAPMLASFHKAADFVPLILMQADYQRFLVSVKRPTNPRVVRDRDEITFLGDSFLENNTGRFEFFQMEAILERDGRALGRQQQTVGADHAQGAKLAVRVPIPLDGARGRGTLTLTVLGQQAASDVRARLRMPVSVEYSPLTLQVARPCYRNCIYATEKLERVEGLVQVHLAESRLANARLQVSLAGVTNEIASVSAETRFQLDASKLALGDHELAAELFQDDGKLLGKTSARIRKVAPRDGEIRLDEHRVARLNGEPWLPFGWFSIPSSDRAWDGLYFRGEYEKNGKRGLNAVMDYNTQFYPADEIRLCLNEAQRAGLRLMFAPLPESAMQSADAMKRPLSDDEARKIREHVRRWKEHPALLGWYMGDEIEAVPAHVGRMEAIYQIVSDEDPYHPCVLLNNTIEGMHKYPRACDVLMPDPYPLFTEGKVAARGIEYLGKFMKEIPRIDGGRLGAWITPEGFNYGDFGQPRGRIPTFNELRCQMYQAIMDGATGFLWYSYWYAQPYPEAIEGVAWLAREAETLKTVILTPYGGKSLAARPGKSPIQTSYRVVGKRRFLIAVNPTGESVEASIQLPDGASRQWHVVSEGRVVETENGNLRDRFDPCATHIYTTDRAIARRHSIADALRQINQTKAARLGTGNLALMDTGATAAASSSHSLRDNLARRAIDGSLMGAAWKSQAPAKLPEWIEVKLTAAKPLARARVSAVNVKAAEVQIRQGNQWESIAVLQPAETGWLTASFQAVTTDAFRILITQASGSSAVSIREVEAYEK